MYLCVSVAELCNIHHRILRLFTFEGNFLMFQIPMVELKKVYSGDSHITKILNPFLATFIRHKEEVGF